MKDEPQKIQALLFVANVSQIKSQANEFYTRKGRQFIQKEKKEGVY
jgi:hypothetical protein